MGDKIKRFIVHILLLTGVVVLSSCSQHREDPVGDGGNWGPPDQNIVHIRGDVAWSPDGTQLAVTWDKLWDERKKGIYLIDTKTWQTTQLKIGNDGDFFCSPTWSPNSEWLAFSLNAQIYKIKRNGDSLTQLTFSSRQFDCDWSPGDSLIAYMVSIGDSAGIWIADKNGAGNRKLVQYAISPQLTNDGCVYYIEGIAPDYDSGHMVLMSLATSQTEEIYRWKKGAPFHSFSGSDLDSNTATIAVSVDLVLHLLDMNTKKFSPLLDFKAGEPSWSPDGSKIAFFKYDYNGGTLWIVDRDGSNLFQVKGW